MDERFKDATPTSTLVVKPIAENIVKIDSITEENLKELTKNEIIDLAQQELGMELDHRLTKQDMISHVLNDSI